MCCTAWKRSRCATSGNQAGQGGSHAAHIRVKGKEVCGDSMKDLDFPKSPPMAPNNVSRKPENFSANPCSSQPPTARGSSAKAHLNRVRNTEVRERERRKGTDRWERCHAARNHKTHVLNDWPQRGKEGDPYGPFHFHSSNPPTDPWISAAPQVAEKRTDGKQTAERAAMQKCGTWGGDLVTPLDRFGKGHTPPCLGTSPKPLTSNSPPSGDLPFSRHDLSPTNTPFPVAQRGKHTQDFFFFFFFRLFFIDKCAR
ncbi:hypothetical protein BDP55DRAFT_141710 [Colletotrichum godetiae]|uniref:Uncharacterized protein n=1 Tax=Colletotrichum godetiae TaxID=1209918 RepID=A0AAJ0B170_9PEZI|nr:uncharacterized protein BDP55DRAFT_141710 [Colletotrichum godetiae]KAK1700729.1 hypothetical protein BDP55DRAFT_141710 [Colletotrichum godetiae]